jgi:CRISP-associated protein Cas1
MIGRVIEIETDGVHLSVERGFMVVAQDHERIGQIVLDDISALIIHGHGATWTANLTARLADRGVPIVICGSNHSPIALVWPIDGHYEQGRRMQNQAEASRPLRKRLWKELVRSKILAQSDALKVAGKRSGALRELARKVRSGDPENIEGTAARRYWLLMMGDNFRRDRSLEGANAMLNYGYMVLRAATARSILAAGLHPSLSVHHESRGNALRLADDLMEPFRPYVDGTVKELIETCGDKLDKNAKARIVKVTTLDLEGPKGLSPLQTCLDRLATSLALVYMGERKHLDLPRPTLSLFSQSNLS